MYFRNQKKNDKHFKDFLEITCNLSTLFETIFLNFLLHLHTSKHTLIINLKYFLNNYIIHTPITAT